MRYANRGICFRRYVSKVGILFVFEHQNRQFLGLRSSPTEMNYSLMTMTWWLFIKYFPSGKQSCLFIVKFCSPRQMLVVFYPFNFQLNSQNQLKHFRPSVALSNFLPRNFPSFLRHSHQSKGWIIFFIINNSRCCNNFFSVIATRV